MPAVLPGVNHTRSILLYVLPGRMEGLSLWDKPQSSASVGPEVDRVAPETVDAWFVEADWDSDGRISGAEAKSFFCRTGLPVQALSKVSASACLCMQELTALLVKGQDSVPPSSQRDVHMPPKCWGPDWSHRRVAMPWYGQSRRLHSSGAYHTSYLQLVAGGSGLCMRRRSGTRSRQ